MASSRSRKRKPRSGPRADLAAVDLRKLAEALRPMVRRMVAEAIEDQLDSAALTESLRQPGRVSDTELRKQLGL